jgi:hypothetical protein
MRVIDEVILRCGRRRLEWGKRRELVLPDWRERRRGPRNIQPLSTIIANDTHITWPQYYPRCQMCRCIFICQDKHGSARSFAIVWGKPTMG